MIVSQLVCRPMDTEKHIHIQHKLDIGKSPNDEGPYYHHTWWEAYKGGVKGKLGGVAIGSIIGAAMGIAVVAAVAVLSGVVISAGGILATIGGFTAAGLLYGAHEFSEVGKVTGAVSAGLSQAELRLKTSEGLEFNQIKAELREIKALVKGEKVDAEPAQEAQKAAADYDDQDYRKTHYAKLTPPKINTFAFWKVALVGLVVGAVTGALLGATGISTEIIEHAVGPKALESGLLATFTHHATAAGALIFGLMGASFGINRDAFRKIFDKTDLWFKGITHGKAHEMVREHQKSEGLKIDMELKGHGSPAPALVAQQQVATAVLPDAQEPVSTQWRDSVLTRAQQALQTIDHSAMTRH